MSALTHACHCGAVYGSRWRLLLHRGFCAEQDPRKHFVPPQDSRQAWDVGSERCWWCLAHKNTPEFDKPCTRRRPYGVELA